MPRPRSIILSRCRSRLQSSPDQSRGGGTRLLVLAPLLLLLAVAAGWYWLQPATQPGLEEGRAIAQAFLDAIRAGTPEAAWEATSAEFKSASGREAFVSQVRQLPALREAVEFISAQTVTVQNEPRTEYLFREPKTGTTVRIVIGKEARQWKVDRWLTN
jgi:hypothetical protein